MYKLTSVDAEKSKHHVQLLGSGPILRETLRAWLDHPGQVATVAERLHVHPQTVRYRVAQLRELFGEALEDADARFEMSLALRADAGVSRPAAR